MALKLQLLLMTTSLLSMTNQHSQNPKAVTYGQFCLKKLGLNSSVAMVQPYQVNVCGLQSI